MAYRSHLLTPVFNISSRYKRLALVSLFLGILLFTSSKSLSFDDPFNDSITSYIPTHDTIKQSILSYFYEDDNNNLLKDIANSNTIDLSEDALNDRVTEHIDISANEISQGFYTGLIKSMHSLKSKIPKLELIKKTDTDRDGAFTKERLYEFLKVEPSQLQTLKDLHEEVYKLIPSKFPKGIYKGTGIVFIGGDKFSWLSLLSIKSLRSFGCKLPVEMIIPTKAEYEHDLCEEILPALNARCVVLHNVLGEEIIKTVEFSGYQYKSLALIASSFDNVLLLDSDNILVSNPESFFKSEVYTKNGLIIWPDYWSRTTSPHFFDITGIKVNESIQARKGKWDLPELLEVKDLSKVAYHDLQGALPEMSSESGQVIIRKTDHVKTILLSFFYNLYGPGFFYPLISQGNSGEGDKDTFISAALRSGEKFYQVKSEIKTFGHPKGDGFEGVCMGQKNPVEDYEAYKALDLNHVEDFDKDGKVSVFTIHANFPKLDPLSLYKENKLKNEKGESFRLYSDIANFLNPIDGNKFDFEFVQFKRMKFMLCELNISLRYFNPISRDELCEFVEGHLKFLRDNPV